MDTKLRKNLVKSLDETQNFLNLKEAQKIICKYYPKFIKDNNNKIITYNKYYLENRKKAYTEYIIYLIFLYIKYFIYGILGSIIIWLFISLAIICFD